MRSLLLDFDRTLVDLQSFTDYPSAVADVYGAMGAIDLSETPATDWASATHEAMAILVSLADQPDRWQQASDLIERHEIEAIESGVAMPGLSQFLAATAESPRAIVTLLGPSALDVACARFGIEVTWRFGREAQFRVKPAPDQVLAACEALEVAPSECVFLGDSSWDEQAAVAAGSDFIGITNGAPSVFSTDATLAVGLERALGLL